MKHNPCYQPPPRPLSAVPAAAPPRFRTTLRIDLRRFSLHERLGPGYDFSRLERYAVEQIDRLAPGDTIDLIVHHFRPVPGRLGFSDPRMQWHVIADDAEIAADWRSAIAATSGWDDPEGGRWDDP